MTAKTPPPGKDILQASSNKFYQGVSLQDLKNFTGAYPLNSRLVKDCRGIREEVYRAGTQRRQASRPACTPPTCRRRLASSRRRVTSPSRRRRRSSAT